MKTVGCAGRATQKLWATLAFAVVILFAFAQSEANATVIIDESLESVTVTAELDSFGLDYACSVDCGGEGQPLHEMTAMSFWTVTTLEADKIVFTVEIMNTTEDQTGDNNRITEFGVDILEPDPVSASTDMPVADNDWDAFVDQTFPTFQKVDVQINDTAGNTGVGDGETDTIILTLYDFDFTNVTGDSLLVTGLLLDTFVIKYQGLLGDTVIDGDNKDSWEFFGTLKPVIDTIIPVPEPSSFALFGFGLAGLGVLSRRRRKQSKAA